MICKNRMFDVTFKQKMLSVIEVRRILCIFCPLRVKFVASTTLHRFYLKITFETNYDASK